MLMMPATSMPFRHFVKLQAIGPNCGYYPEPTKSILIVPPHSLEDAETAFADLDFKVTTGSSYLGSFIGEMDSRVTWIQEKVANWSETVKELASVADNLPQSEVSAARMAVCSESMRRHRR